MAMDLALVIGISDYPDPANRLPAVAADIREMARLLGSENGSFKVGGVCQLADAAASRKDIIDALTEILGTASPDDTVFIYIAGHGAVMGDDYYFVAHDTTPKFDLTGVSLKTIKEMFDASPSRRAFLLLDFCHSGGILPRQTGLASDGRRAIERVIKVSIGHGKVIMAACTPSQSAYEDHSLGHGRFTFHLLRGLRGEAANAMGEVTPNSLHDFIDHQMGDEQQRPMYYSQMTGRIVLMHYGPRTSSSEPQGAHPVGSNGTVVDSSGMWVQLHGSFFLADSVDEKDGLITVVAASESAKVDATIKELRTSQNGSPQTIGFAHGNDAMIVRVKGIDSRSQDGKKRWVITLIPEKINYGGHVMEATIMTNKGRYTPEDLARLRAGRILLNDPPSALTSKSSQGNLAAVEDTLVESGIQGNASSVKVTASGVREVCSNLSIPLPQRLQVARLMAVFQLIVGDVVEHVRHLQIGPIVADKVHVKFLGTRRRRYVNADPVDIEVEGDCELK